MLSADVEANGLRRFAPGKVVALASTLVAVVVVLAVACGPNLTNLCDPSLYRGGAMNGVFLQTCCEPNDYPGGFVTQGDCPNHGTACNINFFDGGVDPSCATSDAGGAGGGNTGNEGDASADGPIEPPCSGACVPLAPLGWDGPSLVWIGPEKQVPPCPDVAPLDRYEGHADLDAGPLQCGACGCEPSTGSCTLPSALTANAANCAGTGPSTPQTPFGVPTGWDGGCTAGDAIAAGKLCGGGPCVASLTIAPLTLGDAGCVPIQPPPSDVHPISWGTFGVACLGAAYGSCQGASSCSPAAAAGFLRCVSHDGDEDCSAPWFTPFTEKHVLYGGITDTRSCAPCACGAPDGGGCSASISIFTDSACSSTLDSVTVLSSGPFCVDVPPGTALGSKSATAPTYTPGTCQPSGGGPSGTTTPTGPTTFCCIPGP